MNGKYEKPLIFASKVSGEGVYLASGAGTDVTSDFEFSLKDKWASSAIYDIVFTSLPAHPGHQQTAHGFLHVSGANIQSVQSFANCEPTFSGNTIDVNLVSYNNHAQILITCDAEGFTVSK